MPKTIELSHTSMSIARSCWKKYYWRYIERLEPIKQSNALTLGKAIHEAFDMYYNNFNAMEVAKYIQDKFQEQISTAAPEEQEDLEISKYTCLGMWVSFPKDLSIFNEIQPEVPFRVKLGHGIYFRGKVDGLLEQKGMKWVRELKTTGLTFPQFERRSLLSSQATGYVYGVTHSGSPVDGIMYDYIKKPLLRKRQTEDVHGFGKRIMDDYKDRPDYYYKRHYVYRQPSTLDEFKKDAVCLACEIRRRQFNGHWPKNTDSCFNFNSECPYAKICHTEMPDPLTVQLYFKRREDDGGTTIATDTA